MIISKTCLADDSSTLQAEIFEAIRPLQYEYYEKYHGAIPLSMIPYVIGAINAPPEYYGYVKQALLYGQSISQNFNPTPTTCV